jgi:hypothetical protein
MKHVVTLAIAAGFIAGWASLSHAQSLGDLARKEEARRKRIAKPGKVYTNEGLAGTSEARPPAPVSGTETPFATPAPKTAPQPEEADPRKTETYWRSRVAKAREGLERSRTFQEALQSRINALTADFTSRDDPAQRATVGANRQKALAELERVNGEIVAFEKELRDIEEEARKAGVPPGWVR